MKHKQTSAEKEIKSRRQVASSGDRLSGHANYSVVKLVKTAKHRHKIALVRGSGWDRGFYAPGGAIAKEIRDANDPSKVNGPVRQVVPETVSQEIVDLKSIKVSTTYVSQQILYTRLSRMYGKGGWRRHWKAKLGGAWFVLVEQKIVLHAWTPETGWSMAVVPPEGLEMPAVWGKNRCSHSRVRT